jgi:hypothetical protein
MRPPSGPDECVCEGEDGFRTGENAFSSLCGVRASVAESLRLVALRRF